MLGKVDIKHSTELQWKPFVVEYIYEREQCCK